LSSVSPETQVHYRYGSIGSLPFVAQMNIVPGFTVLGAVVT
jgi:hypothetical protein